MPDELIAVLPISKGLNRSQFARLKRVRGARSGSGAETVGAKGAHVTNHGELELDLLASGARSLQGVSLISALGQVVISASCFQALDDNMVVPGLGGGIGGKDLRLSDAVEGLGIGAEVNIGSFNCWYVFQLTAMPSAPA